MKYSPKFFHDTMPEWKRKKDPFIAKIIHRPISFLFSSIFAEWGLTPNQVSFISLIIAIITCLLFFSTKVSILILAAILMSIWSITDSADGNMARSIGGKPYGDFIDATSSYYMVGFMFVPMAWSIYHTGGAVINSGNPLIFVLGAIASSSDTMTRLYFNKMRNNAYEIRMDKMEKGEDLEKDITDRRGSKIGRFQQRIDSEFSMGGWNLLFVFPCILCKSLDLYVIFYFLYNGLTFVASIPYLIKKTGCLKK